MPQNRTRNTKTRKSDRTCQSVWRKEREGTLEAGCLQVARHGRLSHGRDWMRGSRMKMTGCRDASFSLESLLQADNMEELMLVVSSTFDNDASNSSLER